MAEEFDPYHKWLSIPPEQQPPNYYRLLGVDDFENDVGVIECLADQRMTFVRSMQTGRYSELSQKLLNELSAARVCLLNDAKRAAYEVELREQQQGNISKLLDEVPAVVQPIVEVEAVDARQAAALQPAPFQPAQRRPSSTRPWLLPAALLGVPALVLVFVIALALVISGNKDSGGDGARVAVNDQDPREPIRVSTPTESEPGRGQDPPVPDPPADDPAPTPPVEPDPMPGPDPAAPAEWIDLLDLVDLKQHNVLGQWQRRGREIYVENTRVGEHWRFMIPVAVEGSYQLHIEFTRIAGRNVHVQLPVGDRGCTLILAGWSNTYSGLHLIDGLKASENESTISPGGIANDRRYALDVSVEVEDDQATIVVRLDGELYLQWRGAVRSLTVHELLELPQPDALGFGAANSTTLLLHSARVRMTSGQARVLKD